MNVVYLPSFIHQFNKLEISLQEEVFEKIEMFKNNPKNPLLKTHKLHGRLRNRYSFSVNYKFRIVCTYISKKEVALLAIGDHDVYKE